LLKKGIVRPIAYDERSHKFLLKNIKNHTHANYMKQKNMRKYSTEDLYFMYNSYINYNLRNLLNLSVFEFSWEHPSKIKNRDFDIEENWVIQDNTDMYLRQTEENKVNLGLDILENGTYWPIVVEVIDGDLYVYEGNHRAFAIKKMVETGDWPEDKKVLCMRVNGDYQRIKARKKVIKLERPVKQLAPFVTIYGDENNKKEDRDFIEKNLFKSDNIEFHSDKKILLKKEVYDYSSLLFLTQALPHWMRDIIWLNQNDTGTPIKSSRVVNDESLWNRFVGGEIFNENIDN
jgi:hypothetical protein